MTGCNANATRAMYSQNQLTFVARLEPLFTPEPSLLGLRQPLPQNHTSSPACFPTFRSPSLHQASPSLPESHGAP